MGWGVQVGSLSVLQALLTEGGRGYANEQGLPCNSAEGGRGYANEQGLPCISSPAEVKE